MAKSNKLVLPDDPWDDHIIVSEDLNEDKDCPICYIEFEKGDNVAKLSCGHIYHKNCIILWFDKNLSSPTCPICRQNMYGNNPNQQQLPNEVQIGNNQNNYSEENSNFDILNDQPNRNRRANNSNKKQSDSCCCILI